MLRSQRNLSECWVFSFSPTGTRIKTDSETHSSIFSLNTLNTLNYLIIEETFLLSLIIQLLFRNLGINCPKVWLSSLQGKSEDQFVSLPVRFPCFLVVQLSWYACLFSQNDMHLELSITAVVIFLPTRRHLGYKILFKHLIPRITCNHHAKWLVFCS